MSADILLDCMMTNVFINFSKYEGFSEKCFKTRKYVFEFTSPAMTGESLIE